MRRQGSRRPNGGDERPDPFGSRAAMIRKPRFGPPRRGKFGAIRVEVDGIKFASRKEARRYGELRVLERAGEISALRCQPRYPIVINGTAVKYPSGRALEYVGDFSY